jgi:RHS repeat-associated protein
VDAGAGSNYPFLTLKERDIETGLDYLEARYYSSTQGRFTSPDEPFADQEEDEPQSWNLYSYVRNNPIRFIDPTGEGHIDPKTGAYVGDKDGECEDGLCWDAKNQVWVDKVPVKGGSVTAPPETVDTHPIMAGAVLALTLSPPPVKAAVAVGGVLIGGAVLAAYLDSTTIHVSAPPLGPITTVTSPKIEIAGPVPPPPPIMKKKGEKKQIRAAAGQVGVAVFLLRKAVHQYKKDNGMRGDENLDWKTLISIAEEIRKRLEK